MVDYFFRFPDKSAATAAIQMLRDVLMTNVVIDDVGEIYVPAPDAVEDEDGNIPHVLVAGYHVNVRLLAGELPDELAAYQVFPESPSRVFS